MGWRDGIRMGSEQSIKMVTGIIKSFVRGHSAFFNALDLFLEADAYVT